MSLTTSDHHWHRVYAASSELRTIIEDAYTAANQSISLDAPPVSGEFLKTFGDDRAETLIAAITRYICESNPSHPAVVAALENAAKEDET